MHIHDCLKYIDMVNTELNNNINIIDSVMVNTRAKYLIDEPRS